MKLEKTRDKAGYKMTGSKLVQLLKVRPSCSWTTNWINISQIFFHFLPKYTFAKNLLVVGNESEIELRGKHKSMDRWLTNLKFSNFIKQIQNYIILCPSYCNWQNFAISGIEPLIVCSKR